MFLSKKLNKGGGSVAATPDAQFNYVTMLLHGDGTNGAQNNTFLDSSTNAFSITRNGNTTQGSFSPYGPNWSNFFVDSGYLKLTSNSSLNFGTGDFTIEGWLNLNTITGVVIDFRPVSTQGDYPLLYFSGSNLLFYASGGAQITSGTVTTGSWFHFALCRSGSSMKMFFNGVQTGSTYTASVNYSVGSTLGIGTSTFALGSSLLEGYMSNLRVLKGTALYTTTFTPSTTPLTAITNTSLLTCQSNRFIDNSTNAFAITATYYPSVQRFNPFGTATAYDTSVIGGSGYFDGSGDYLTTTMTGGLGSGDFTVEIWVYATSIYNYITWFATTRDANGFSCGTDANGALVWVNGVGGTTRKWDGATTAGNIIRVNSWNHVAFVRSSNAMRVYLNGVATVTAGSASSVSDTANYSNTNLSIGQLVTAGENPTGYLCDGRITTSALYTSNFTPPTAPLTAVSGVRLLNNYTNGAIFDNAMINNLETVGNAQISTSVVKYGTGSMYFDGNGDWLLSYDTLCKEFGSNAFTIECWAYITDNSSRKYIVTAGINTASHYNFGLELGGSGVINMWASSNGTSWNLVTSDTSEGQGITTIPLNQWNHIAMVRESNGTFKSYLNGVLQCTVSGKTAAMVSQPTYPLNVGRSAYTGSFGNFNGYIDDLRITKGYARYTANFTPPTAAFPNTGPV